MGVVGLYISIIFIEVKRRPNYVIDTVVRKAEDSMPDKTRSSAIALGTGGVPAGSSSDVRATAGGHVG
jgi:hypothetical protein